MQEIKIIDKDIFMKSLDKHNPNKFILFVNKYFPIKYKSGEYPIGTWSAMIGFAVASLGMITFDQMGNKDMANAFCLLYIPLVVHVLLNIVSFKLNQYRIDKICKELELSHEDYNFNIGYHKI